MKKIFLIGLYLFVMLMFLSSCNQNNIVTLENMKKALEDTGYTINEDYELYDSYENETNLIDGFSFVFLGSHGKINTPVLEFKDNISAELYSKTVNATDDFFAIINDKFLIIIEAHRGTPHEKEKIFFEKIITGKFIK